jgi:hypothetical protein
MYILAKFSSLYSSWGVWLSGRASALHKIIERSEMPAEGPGFDHLPVHELHMLAAFFLPFDGVGEKGLGRFAAMSKWRKASVLRSDTFLHDPAPTKAPHYS